MGELFMDFNVSSWIFIFDFFPSQKIQQIEPTYSPIKRTIKMVKITNETQSLTSDFAMKSPHKQATQAAFGSLGQARTLTLFPRVL